MRFFRTLLADDRSSTTQFADESFRVETIDVVGPATLSSPLASHAQATATDGSLAFDVEALDAGAPAHTTAPAWLKALDVNHAVHRVPAPVDQAAGVETVSVPDTSTAAAIETVVAAPAVVASANATPTSGVVTSHEAPVAHAVDATPATPSAGTDGVVPSSVVPAVGAFVVLGDGHATPQIAVPHAVLVPWEITAEGATTTIGATAPSATETAAASEAASIPRPADGADRWENHSMFSVNPPDPTSTPESIGGGDAAGAGTSGEASAVHEIDSAMVLPIGIATTPVTAPAVHAIVGTAIIDAVDPVAPEVTPIPRPADGADRWENHSMFSVNPPSEGKAAETMAEEAAGVTAVTAVTSESTHPAEAVNDADADALRNFLDNWMCILPVQPESLRNAHFPEITLPLLTGEALIVPQVVTAEVYHSTIHQGLTAEVYHSTTHDAVTAASMPLVIAEQYAVL